MKQYPKSEYDRTYKYYDDIYSFMRDVNTHTARERKKQNTSHTPFAWEEELEDVDIPNIPSDFDWLCGLQRNNPRPADMPIFKRKHARFLAAYEEQKKMKKIKAKKLNASPKGSCSCDYGINKNVARSNSSMSIQSMPASMPSSSSPTLPRKKGIFSPVPAKFKGARSSPVPGADKLRKAVQTPNWSKLDDEEKGKKSTKDKKEEKKSEKTVQMKSPVGKSPSAGKIDESQVKRPCFEKKEEKKKESSKGKYIVSRDSKLEERLDQPFTGFGYGNKNKETAHKMTANVKAPCDVYATALIAAKANRQKKLNPKGYENESKPLHVPKRNWLKEKTGTFYDSEYISNYTYPDQTLMAARRLQAREVVAKAKKSCGIIRKAKQ